jgi:hypothetical protein
MARKKRPAFNGSKKAEAEARLTAQTARSVGNSYAELDRVRAWAREGRPLIAAVLSQFPSEVEAIRQFNEDPSEENGEALVAARLRALLSAMLVRDLEDPLEVIGTMMGLDESLRILVERLPTTVDTDGVDVADEVLRGTHTVEESALVLNMSAEAIEKRRTRRRRR